MAVDRTAFLTYRNHLGLPDELVQIIEQAQACEYASLRRDGTPITSPVSPAPGLDGRTIDVSTGLAYPLKAERARLNPKVCLLFSARDALPGDDPPTALVYGQATVHDADLQANTDYYVALTRATSESFQRMPLFAMRWMRGYLARIRIAVTPLEVLWWPRGDVSVAPQHWSAPDGTQPEPSDPAPRPLGGAHRPLVATSPDWRTPLEQAVACLGPPVLTTVDEDGFPVPFRVDAELVGHGAVRLAIPPAMPTAPRGRACLTFHTLQVKNGEMVANENCAFVGAVEDTPAGCLFKVERILPSVSFRPGLRGNLALLRLLRRLRPRLEPEAARRGQRVPVVRTNVEVDDA